MIRRTAGQKIEQAVKNKGEFNNILLIEGARQVGKTTLVRQILQQLRLPYKEFNLEEQRVLVEKIDLCADFQQFTDLVQAEMGFRIGGKEILFIDEAQESQKLGGFVRFMKEKWPHTQVILSGSTMSRLFREDVRFPVGRATMIHLQPFSFEEFLLAGHEDFLIEKFRSFDMESPLSPGLHDKFLVLLEKYMEIGGLPEVVTTFFQGGDWKDVRQNILLGYYSDFKRVFGEEKQAYFIAALKAVASLLASPFKNSYVAALMGGGKNQEIIKALSRLEAWKMVLTVDQRGPVAETEFHPKRYLFDTGIAKQLREASLPAVSLRSSLMPSTRRSPLGGLMENVVVNVLQSRSSDLAGWRKSSSGSEIDFVLKAGNEAIPIECKAALSVKNTHLRGVLDFIKTYQSPRGIVVALAPFEIRKLDHDGKRRIVILPLYLAERAFW